MAENKQIEVVIDDKAYNLAGVENEKYIRNISEYVDKKIKEISSSAIGVAKNSSAFLVLVALNIADDFYREKDSVKVKIKKATESLTEQINKLNEENKELTAKLEQSENEKAELAAESEKAVSEDIAQQAEIYKREYENLKEQMKEVKLELNKAKSQLGSAKCELEKHKNEKNDLKISLSNIKDEKDKLENSLESEKNANNELRVALEGIKNENNMLKNGYDKLKDSQNGDEGLKIAQLEKELEDTCKELEAYKENEIKNNNLIEKAQREAELAKAELAEYIETFSV